MEAVTLVCSSTGREKEFSTLHAENILRYQVKRNIAPADRWELKQGSRFTFENNELRSNAGTGRHKKGRKKATVQG